MTAHPGSKHILDFFLRALTSLYLSIQCFELTSHINNSLRIDFPYYSTRIGERVGYLQKTIIFG